MGEIFIRAYTRLNLGDDLFLKVICDRYPDKSFNVICGKEYKSLVGISNGNLNIKNENPWNMLIRVFSSKVGFKIDFFRKKLIKN